MRNRILALALSAPLLGVLTYGSTTFANEGESGSGVRGGS